ncbi:MAG: Flp pilus assembly protein TadD [Gammaproteobacteria bacterium]|nr:MAG: Flp pilus assembly protein TadD [Gammaproteobacteria bacterium]TND06716.1 MAG: Flp pilus assembly protein TadD [Gammaproteobacteria bacterium]
MSINTSEKIADVGTRSAALLDNAVRAHESGDIARAARLYRKILATSPGHADALNLLGVTELQQGNPAAATSLIEQAISHNPRAPSYYQNLASACAAAGDTAKAITCHRSALSIDPLYLAAHIALAGLLQNQGQRDEAVRHCEQALSIDPAQPGILNDLGSIYLELERIDDAEQCYIRAAHLRPAFPEAINNLGHVALKRNNPELAIEHFTKATELAPAFSLAHFNLGVALLKLNRADDAVHAFRRTLECDGNNANALRILAELQHGKGEPAAAAACYRRLLTIEPDNVDTLNSLGLAELQQNRIDDALPLFEKALAINPAHAHTLNSYGNALCQQGKTADAIAYFESALKLQPGMAEAHCNLGNALKSNGDFAGAIQHYRSALSLKRDYAAAHMNMGTAFKDMGDYSAAYGRFDEAIMIQPDLADAHLNKGIVMLTLGRFADAWKAYESRIQILERRPDHRTMKKPRWKGEPLAGKRILVHAEQGIGDSMHFVRYLPMLKAMGADVIFECPPGLIDLFTGLQGVDQLIVQDTRSAPDVDFDYHTYLLSLPALFGTTFRTIPNDVPYLHADPARIGLWKEKMVPGHLNVGLAWAGNPRHANNKNRSCSLADFARLCDIPGVTFHSLQKGTGAEQTANPPAGMHLIDAANEQLTFADSAALVENLDLVISVDTSVAHLGGAMGKPVWVLLSYVADWRWLLDRSDSPWYPSMRLFRQPEPQDWPGTFAALATELRAVAATRQVPARYYDRSHDVPNLMIGRRFNRSRPTVRPNILISTNTDGEFARYGIQNLLTELIGDFNPIVHRRHPDIAQLASDAPDRSYGRDSADYRDPSATRDNSWHPGINLETADLAIFTGITAWRGDMAGPLVDRLIKTTIPTMYLGLGSASDTEDFQFEQVAVLDQLLLIRSLLVTVRDTACGNTLRPLNPHQLPCPTLLCAKTATWRTQTKRIALSTPGISRRTSECLDPSIFHYTVNLYRELARHYECALVCHHISELAELTPLLGDIMDFHYSSDAIDYLRIYDAFDMTITTRAQDAGLCASLGIPAFVISAPQYFTSANGFLSKTIDPSVESAVDVVERLRTMDIAAESARLIAHKTSVRNQYIELLRSALDSVGLSAKTGKS